MPAALASLAVLFATGLGSGVYAQNRAPGTAAQPPMAGQPTPIDRASPEGAAQWVFLSEALEHLPRRASYTIRASTGDEEMNLYMMSLGLYQGHLPYPNSYFGISIPGYAANADFVLDYGCGGAGAGANALVNVARVRGGCIQRAVRKKP